MGELRLTVDFNMRYFQVGQGEWIEMARNDVARWVVTLSPAARWYTTSGRYLRKWEISESQFYLYRLISGAIPIPMYERLQNQNKIAKRNYRYRNSATGIKEMFANFLSQSIHMFPGDSLNGRESFR